MGTLDDAIREHLELKRRSGASDAEVTRLESEAFGPARREAPRPAEPEAAIEAEAEAEVDVAAPPAAEHDVPPPPPAAPIADEEPATRIAEVTPPPPPEPPPPAPAAREPEVPRSTSWLDDEDFEPEHTAEFTAAEHREASGEPPSDYVAPDEEGDDLLEETPDFLQETPEHDRLWFEQKPPRDFDFDN